MEMLKTFEKNPWLEDEVKKILDPSKPFSVHKSCQDIQLIRLFLIYNKIYTIMVDEYPIDIVNKKSLLEALYFQGELIIMNSLNWDAFIDALNSRIRYAEEFFGMVFVFKKKLNIEESERIIFFEILDEIASELNIKISVLLNECAF